MRGLLLGISVMLTGCLLCANPVEYVTNRKDCGPGSLRNALTNVNPGGNVIVSIGPQKSYTIDLKSQLNIDKDVTIDGKDIKCPMNLILKNVAQNSRVFNIGINSQPSVTIKNVTITGGNITGDGGAISLNEGAELILKHCTVDNNTASRNDVYGTYGGAIYCDTGSRLFLVDCIFSNNTVRHGCYSGMDSFGGAIASCGGDIYVTNGTQFINNVAIADTYLSEVAVSSAGGAICINNAFLYLDRAMFKNNTAEPTSDTKNFSIGGAIYAFNTKITVSCLGITTIKGNHAINRLQKEYKLGGGISYYNGTITGYKYLNCTNNDPDNIEPGPMP